ncbi:unnamed protein product, partial [Heterotrigona itama]
MYRVSPVEHNGPYARFSRIKRDSWPLPVHPRSQLFVCRSLSTERIHLTGCIRRGISIIQPVTKSPASYAESIDFISIHSTLIAKYGPNSHYLFTNGTHRTPSLPDAIFLSSCLCTYSP